MAGCRIVNEGVSSAVEAINGYATLYRTAGETLITSLSSAIADMEGAAKDASVAHIYQTHLDNMGYLLYHQVFLTSGQLQG